MDVAGPSDVAIIVGRMLLLYWYEYSLYLNNSFVNVLVKFLRIEFLKVGKLAWLISNYSIDFLSLWETYLSIQDIKLTVFHFCIQKMTDY